MSKATPHKSYNVAGVHTAQHTHAFMLCVKRYVCTQRACCQPSTWQPVAGTIVKPVLCERIRTHKQCGGCALKPHPCTAPPAACEPMVSKPNRKCLRNNEMMAELLHVVVTWLLCDLTAAYVCKTPVSKGLATSHLPSHMSSPPTCVHKGDKGGGGRQWGMRKELSLFLCQQLTDHAPQPAVTRGCESVMVGEGG